eukprot:gene23095-26151_t
MILPLLVWRISTLTSSNAASGDLPAPFRVFPDESRAAESQQRPAGRAIIDFQNGGEAIDLYLWLVSDNGSYTE